MHDITRRHSENNEGVIQSNFQRRELASNNVAHGGHHEFNPFEDFKKVLEFGERQNRFANSPQTFRRINYLEQENTNLHQQMRSHEKQVADLVSYNFLLSKSEIQGISGYVCKRCQTFSFRPILDLGYDMTMQVKHRCEYQIQNNSYIISIPPNIEKVDEWAAQILRDHLNFYVPIGKYLASFDISTAFYQISNKLDTDSASKILGVPDRYNVYSLEKDYQINWVDRAVANFGKKILMIDYEILDFLGKVKSTYAIFEIPTASTIRRVLMYLTL